MKRLIARSPRYESGPNMTPLVDVVMVILIFLMLAGSFGSNEHVLKSSLPVAVGARSGGPAIDPGRRLDVYVTATADVDFAARTAAFGDVYDADVLRARLAEQRGLYVAAGTPPESVMVVIHPGPAARWGPVAAAYDAALRAEFQKVVFAQTR